MACSVEAVQGKSYSVLGCMACGSNLLWQEMRLDPRLRNRAPNVVRMGQHFREQYCLGSQNANCETIKMLDDSDPLAYQLGIDRYGFFGAAMHGPIPIFLKFLIFFNQVSCFIVKNIMYTMPYLFFKNFKNQILGAKFFKLQQFPYFTMIFNSSNS